MANLDRIACCKIHPCIGIARVGNAPEDYFIGPEVPGRVPDEFFISPAAPGQVPERGEPGYKDSKGRVKRQAARFRIFGYDRNGNVVAELDSKSADVTWRVHLANRKAAWYIFKTALDLGALVRPDRRRNASVSGKARRRLIIDPGSKTIKNKSNQCGSRYRFTGKFMGTEVYLGELRTDERGHLLVFGGMGKSGSTKALNKSKNSMSPPDFENNDGWYDDIADGPVRATVQIGKCTFEAAPAMVVVTPPNFAPGLYGVVTMYDVVVDLFRREFGYKDPDHAKSSEVEFWREIYPIFNRLVAGQWVNLGIFLAFGHGSPADFTAPALLNKLKNHARNYKLLRQRIFRCFRDPREKSADPARWPPFYGDVLYESMTNRRTGLALTMTQWDALRKWSRGDFTTARRPTPPGPIGNLPVAKRPHALDRANLEDCLGGPFHPGIELPWSLRLKRMWAEPFRLKVLDEGETPRDDWGVVLRPKTALKPNGPFAASGPGTISRVLGAPWQISVAVCDAGYESGTYLPLPSFWAARVPNHVLDARSYRKMIDTRLAVAQRRKHFAHRQPWLRFFWSNYDQRFSALAWPMYGQRINAMVANWSNVGIVTERRGPTDHRKAGLPARPWAETLVNRTFTKDDPTFNQISTAETLQMAGRGSRPTMGPLQQRTRPMLHSAILRLLSF